MPLLWLSIAFLTGICAAKPCTLTWLTWVITSAVSIPFLFLEQKYLKRTILWSRFRSLVPVPLTVIFLFFLLGGLRYAIEIPQFSPSDLAFYNDNGAYTLTGVVTAPPDRREDAVYLEVSIFEIEDLSASDPQQMVQKVHGTVRVKLPADAGWQYGDVLRFNGSLLTPADGDGFSYKDYLARQRIHSITYFPQHVERVSQGKGFSFRMLLENIRQKAWTTIFRQLPQPESGLLAGILLGLDNDLPVNLEKAYQDTGTAHIIAISGFNMAILVGIITTGFSRFTNRYWAAVLTLFAVAVYTVFVGGSPSVIRAAIMSVSALGAHLVGRRQAGLNALGLTAALMCLFNPLLIWDVSFQLSFFATLGLLLFGSPLKELLNKFLESRVPEGKVEVIAKPISEYLLFTLAAQVTTLPVIAYHFGRVSVSSLIANPLVLPVQPPILVLGGIATIIGAFLPGVGKVLALLPWMLMRYTNWIVERLSKLHTASLSIHPQMAIWIIVVLVLFILVFVLRNFFKKLFGRWFAWAVVLLVVAAAASWSIVSHHPDGSLHLDVVSTGEETVLFIRDPQGKVIVLNPGKRVNELSAALSGDLSPWDYAIDEVLITERSSAGNLDLLDERIPITQVLLFSNIYQAGADQRPVTIPEGIQINKIQPDQVYEYPSGLLMSAAAEDIENAAIYLVYGQTRVLIPNGVDFALIREQSPQALNDLTILVLQDEDISYIPPRVWQRLDPQLVIWNSTSVCPVSSWLGLDALDRISLVSDGTTLSMDS